MNICGFFFAFLILMFNTGGLLKFHWKDFNSQIHLPSKYRDSQDPTASSRIYNGPHSMGFDPIKTPQVPSLSSPYQNIPIPSGVPMNLTGSFLENLAPLPHPTQNSANFPNKIQNSMNGLPYQNPISSAPFRPETPDSFAMNLPINQPIPPSSISQMNTAQRDSKEPPVSATKTLKPSTIKTKSLKIGNHVFNGGKVTTKFQYGKKMIILEFQTPETPEAATTHLKQVLVKFSDVEFFNIDSPSGSTSQNLLRITISRFSFAYFPRIKAKWKQKRETFKRKPA